MEISVTFSAKTEPVPTRPKSGDVASAGAASTICIPLHTGAQRSRQLEGREKISTRVTMSPTLTPYNYRGVRLKTGNLEKLGRKDPLAAALASVSARSDRPSYSPFVTRPGPAEEKSS